MSITPAVAQSAKIKYINNKELLAAIHESKKSFCSFVDEAHSNHDIIVLDKSEITQELIDKVKAKKASPRGKPSIDINTITTESLVFRVMTYEHIPEDPIKSRKSKVVGDKLYVKAGFPPFKHYIMTEDGLKEVLRSHWKGGIENGHFCTDNGKINNRLAMMMMLLVERYSRRGNWRGYTYVDEMRSQAHLQLAQIGLQFDESKSDNPFAFYTTVIKNCFTRILNLEKKNQNIRDDLLIMAGATPSYTRQVENELEYRLPEGAKSTRGRKPKAPPLVSKSDDLAA
jgi:hypothetical protein